MKMIPLRISLPIYIVMIALFGYGYKLGADKTRIDIPEGVKVYIVCEEVNE